jgi:hypothetical protein
MITSYAVNHPTVALVLAGLDVDELGQFRTRRADLHRRQRRFQRRARLRKQLA